MSCANCCNNCYMEFYKVEVVPAAELDDQIAQAVLASGVQVDGSAARRSSPRLVKFECSPNGGCGGNCYQCDMNRRGHGFYPLVINVIDAGGKGFGQPSSETADILGNRQSKNAAPKAGKVTFSSPESAPQTLEDELDEEPTKSMLDTYLESKKKAKVAPAANQSVSSEQEPEERPPVRVLESGGIGRYPRRFPAQGRAVWSAGNQFAFAQSLARQDSDEVTPVLLNHKQFAAGVVRRQKKCDENGCRLEEYYHSQ